MPQHPIEIYNGTPGSGPNPWKVILILEELQVPYTIKWIPYASIKSEPYLTLNPNGRLPAMVDPDHGVVLFESGAIIEYLVETYGTQHQLGYGGGLEKWLLRSWLYFQASGQGPMFGQKMWFTHFHREVRLASALERYGDESKRILGVIEAHLLKRKNSGVLDGQLWLVGEKCTYADLAFVPWNLLLGRIFPPEDGFDLEREFPLVAQWQARMESRPAVAKTIAFREECLRTMENSAAAVLPKRE